MTMSSTGRVFSGDRVLLRNDREKSSPPLSPKTETDEKP